VRAACGMIRCPQMARVLPVVVATLASTGGCAQLAGIDNTSGSGRTVDSVKVTRLSIGNQVVPVPLDLSGLPARYLLATDSAGVYDRVYASPTGGPGTWTRDLAAPAPVEFLLPDVPTPVPRLFDFPNRQLQVLFAPLEHPDRAPAPSGAMLTVTAPLDVAATAMDSFQVFTVGSWTQFALTAGVGATSIGPITYPFSTSTSLSGRAQLDKLTTQDAFLVLRYTGSALTGVAEATPFDQTGADMVTMPKLTAVAPDQTLDVRVSPPTLAMRYAAVRPTVGTLTMTWNVVAAPGYRIASNSGPPLQSGTLLMADVGVSAKYGNPFAGRDWHAIFKLQTTETRTAMLPGPMGPALPVTLFAGMNQFVEPSPGLTLGLDAGLPVLILIDGKQLAVDTNQTIAQPSKFAEVTFLADNTNATLYNLQVLDLLPNAAVTAFDAHLVFAAASAEAKFEVPPEIFQVGHYYTLRAFCTYGGYPGIADGDFTNRQLPLTQSFLDSGVFMVTP